MRLDRVRFGRRPAPSPPRSGSHGRPPAPSRPHKMTTAPSARLAPASARRRRDTDSREAARRKVRECEGRLRRATRKMGGPVVLQPVRTTMRATNGHLTRGWRAAARLPEPGAVRNGIARHSYRWRNRVWYNHRRQRVQASEGDGPNPPRHRGLLLLGTLVLSTPAATEVFPVESVFRDEESAHATGPEDPRYFTYRDRLWCVCNGPLRGDPSIRAMHLLDLEGKRSVPLTLEGERPRAVEKNWSPMIVKEELWFVYSVQPLCILKLVSTESGRCRIIHGAPRGPVPSDSVRGGTPLIELRDGWYGGFGHIGVCTVVDQCLRYDAISVLVHAGTKETRLGPIVYMPRTDVMPTTSRGFGEVLGLESGAPPVSITFPYHFERAPGGYSLGVTYQDSGDIEYILTPGHLRQIGWPV